MSGRIDRRSFVCTGAATMGVVWAGRVVGAGLGSDGAAAEGSGRRSAQQDVYARAVVLDALAPDGPGFDAKAAIDAGLTGAIVNM